MKKNVKVIASLVRKAKKKLHQGKRDEALELMRKAVDVDDNNGVLVQVIQFIGRKNTGTEPEEEPAETTVEIPEEEPVEIFEFTPEEIFVDQETEPVEILEFTQEEMLVDQETESAQTELETPAEEQFEILEFTPEEMFLDQETEPVETAVENNHERKSSMASEDRITKIFEASDREYNNGHQQKAIAYLKRAMKIDPDNPEVQLRIDLLKTKIKSANLVQIARKKLVAGKVAEAVVLARRAFEMIPETNGLEELLSDIETESNTVSSSLDGSNSETTAEYIVKIRQLVQDNALEKAASFAERSFRLHPNDKLLMEFIDNFKKLGLIE
ncbi:MAG: hypothetical protein K8S15_11950 [Candidatus Aegiribacteria sp.]|nr:hypothetical protein [Candidatus Aegiribacteria sp.]